MINVDNITKSFGDRTLFEETGFRINTRERVGLVGRNGHGKTTLLKMLVGEETPDSGAIRIPKNYRIGHVRQQLEFSEATVLAEAMLGLPANEQGHHWKVEKILDGLGFSTEAMQRAPAEFSGGFQVRLNLAKVLVSEPDLLLLDEPTNYLDITSIRWIERFLSSWPHELVLITHDRSFMDRLVTHVVGIHRRKMRKISGTTDKYYTQIAQDEEIYEKTRLNDERKRKDIELFITRFRAKARLANMVQSRVKTLAKMEKKDKLDKMATLEFTFRQAPFSAKQILQVNGLRFTYDDKQAAAGPLIRNFSLSVLHGDRICVVGPNGKGKTTLLKLLAGKLAPQQGTVTYHATAETGFYEQTNVETLVPQRTVEEEILSIDPTIGRQVARNICGAMLFRGDDALKKIQVLSGGEKSRVMLGKVLATPINLLLLDEPTNHLDMDACDALLAAIDNFDGAVIMVTHNEMFLHALAQRLVVFQNDDVEVFEGGYEYFLEKVGWQDAGFKPAATAGPRPSKKEIRRRRSAFLTQRAKVLGPLKEKIRQVEGAIEAEEAALEKLNRALLEATEQQDVPQIAERSQKIHHCQTKIETLFFDLETTTDELTTREKTFDAKQSVLEADLGISLNED